MHLKTKNNISKIKPHELTFEALLCAYFECRRHKRNTFQAMEFEFDLEKNLHELYEDLCNETYEIGQSICFVVTLPKAREVWAGAFRDRVVHHLVYNALRERFETRFVQDTFSCIPTRGTLAAAKKAEKYSKIVSNNYKKRAYYVKMDISNFFNSIDKTILYNETVKYVPEEWLSKLIHTIIYNNPVEQPYVKSPKKLFQLLPKHKSLFNTPPTRGLPIGNLTSQFFSNVYLNPLDQFIKHKLKCKYFCRYVDDIIIFDECPKKLNHAYAEINKFLQNNLAMELAHRKKVMNTICKGFDFVGQFIRPYRKHPRTVIIKKAFRTIKDWEASPSRFTDDGLNKFVSKINSYLGMFKHVNAYNLRKKACMKSASIFTTCDEAFTKVIIVKHDDEKFSKIPEIYPRLRKTPEGDWHLRAEEWENCPENWKKAEEAKDYESLELFRANLDNE